MSMMQEFKEFAVKGNVVDLAVGVVIGAAFGKIVTSFVADVVMPPIGVLLGGVDFGHLGLVVKEAQGDKPAVVVAYGKFIMAIIDFLIIAFVVFLAVKGFNRLRRKEAAAPAPPPPPSNEAVLLGEIRDLLREKR